MAAMGGVANTLGKTVYDQTESYVNQFSRFQQGEVRMELRK